MVLKLLKHLEQLITKNNTSYQFATFYLTDQVTSYTRKCIQYFNLYIHMLDSTSHKWNTNWDSGGVGASDLAPSDPRLFNIHAF